MLIIIYHWSTWLAWCLNLYITTKHGLLVECNELTFHCPSLNPFMLIDYLPDLCHNGLIVFISNKHNPQHYSWILSSLASSWIPVTCCDIPNQDLLPLPDRWSAPHWVPKWRLTPHYSGTFSCLFALSIEQVFYNSNSKGRMAPWGRAECRPDFREAHPQGLYMAEKPPQFVLGTQVLPCPIWCMSCIPWVLSWFLPSVDLDHPIQWNKREMGKLWIQLSWEMHQNKRDKQTMDPVILRWCKTKETGKLWSFETGIWRSSTAAITWNTGDSSEMNCPKGGSFGCCKDSHMKLHTLVACTFFISRGKWKGHHNDGRSNKDNSVVNWKLEQMQQTMCAKPIQEQFCWCLWKIACNPK